MISKRFLLFTILGFTILGLVGCEMSKSTPPPKKTQQKGISAIGTELATAAFVNPATQLAMYATQTEVAKSKAENEILGTPTGENPYLTPGQELISPTALPPDFTPPASTDLTSQPALIGTDQAQGAVSMLTTSVPAANIPPPTAGPLPQTYTLQNGEFPYCIARRLNVSVTNLLNINGIGGSVSPGMSLKIPQDGAPFAGERALLPHPTTYTVKGGDTIYSIACAFGDVDPNYMAQVNNVPSPYNLTPGQVLQIP